jgi:xanthine dehydrogenase accessory factor
VTHRPAALARYLAAEPSAALVEVAAAKGSTPREAGAWMLVAPTRTFGTIGGGQLEFMAIDKARQMLGAATLPPLEAKARGHGTSGLRTAPPAERIAKRATLDIPLGPEIGQCCGGRVELSVRLIDKALKAELIENAAAEEARLPHVYLFGGGHVGQALAAALALLPLRVAIVETRADALDGMPEGIVTKLTPVPEEMVRAAPAGAAFVVLTHDHALDFLIVGEALRRQDAAYVGMIGSKTKKATFRNWYLKTAGGTDTAFSRLVSPIGGNAIRDKRPAVIAALAAAEIMTALALSSARAEAKTQA